jgi:hypothetical protein
MPERGDITLRLSEERRLVGNDWGYQRRVIVAASTVAIVAIVVAIVVIAMFFVYVLPRGRRRRLV